MTKALILGVLGQDGIYLAQFLRSMDYEVTGLSHFVDEERKKFFDSQVSDGILKQADIRNIEELRKIIEFVMPDEVYNLAGFSSVHASWSNNQICQEINYEGFVNISTVVSDYELKFSKKVKLYQASSSEIYGGVTNYPQNENTVYSPISPYGKSKLAAHVLATKLREKNGQFIALGILYNHESPLRPANFVTRKISNAVAEIHLGSKDPLILQTLNSRRDWGFAGDYVKAMWKMLQLDFPETFVIATGISTSLRELLTLSFQIVGIKDWENYVVYSSAKGRPIEPYNLVGDAEKAYRLLGWKYQFSIRDTMNLMISADIERLKHKMKEIK